MCCAYVNGAAAIPNTTRNYQLDLVKPTHSTILHSTKHPLLYFFRLFYSSCVSHLNCYLVIGGPNDLSEGVLEDDGLPVYCREQLDDHAVGRFLLELFYLCSGCLLSQSMVKEEGVMLCLYDLVCLPRICACVKEEIHSHGRSHPHSAFRMCEVDSCKRDASVCCPEHAPRLSDVPY